LVNTYACIQNETLFSFQWIRRIKGTPRLCYLTNTTWQYGSLLHIARKYMFYLLYYTESMD